VAAASVCVMKVGLPHSDWLPCKARGSTMSTSVRSDRRDKRRFFACTALPSCWRLWCAHPCTL